MTSKERLTLVNALAQAIVAAVGDEAGRPSVNVFGASAELLAAARELDASVHINRSNLAKNGTVFEVADLGFVCLYGADRPLTDEEKSPTPPSTADDEVAF